MSEVSKSGYEDREKDTLCMTSPQSGNSFEKWSKRNLLQLHFEEDIPEEGLNIVLYLFESGEIDYDLAMLILENVIDESSTVLDILEKYWIDYNKG